MATDDDLDKLLDSTLDDLEDIEKTKRTAPTNVNITKPTPTPTPITPSTSSSSTTTTSTSSSTTSKSPDELSDEFAKQMVGLLESLQQGGGGDIQKNIEEMVKNMGGLQLPTEEGEPSSSSGGDEDGEPSAKEKEDLETILDAFKELDQNAGTGSIAEQLKKMAENAKNMGAAGEEGGGEDIQKMLEDFENNPEFQSVMEGMVNQMISKDVLYEPMKELREKYPKWLDDNRSKLAEEEYSKYIKQYDIVQKICCVYESAPENASADQMQEVVQLMQDMAEYGQPPAEIIQELAPGVQIGADGVPVFPGAENGDPANTSCSIM